MSNILSNCNLVLSDKVIRLEVELKRSRMEVRKWKAKYRRLAKKCQLKSAGSSKSASTEERNLSAELPICPTTS